MFDQKGKEISILWSMMLEILYPHGGYNLEDLYFMEGHDDKCDILMVSVKGIESHDGKCDIPDLVG